MNTPHEQEYQHRTHSAQQQREGERHGVDGLRRTRYLTKARPMWARLCQREAALRKAGKGMRPYAAEGWQGAPATSMCCVLRRLMLPLLLCCVLLIFASPRSAKIILVVLMGTPHARTEQRAPVASIEALRMTVVEHRAHM